MIEYINEGLGKICMKLKYLFHLIRKIERGLEILRCGKCLGSCKYCCHAMKIRVKKPIDQNKNKCHHHRVTLERWHDETVL